VAPDPPPPPSQGFPTFTVDLPAHEYDYDIPTFEETAGIRADKILAQFNDRFPKDATDMRIFDITHDAHTTSFIYYTEFLFEVSIVSGFTPSRDQIIGTCPSLKDEFAFVVEGNTAVWVNVNIRQPYGESNVPDCHILPEYTEVAIAANLRNNADPCDATNDNGCNAEIEQYTIGIFDLVRTKATMVLFVGQPYAHEDSYMEGFPDQIAKVQQFVLDNGITVTVSNPIYLRKPNDAEGASETFSKDFKVLILGYNQETSDSLVSFFSDEQDHFPLLYLYAPPTHRGATSITMDMSVQVSSTLTVQEDFEEGGGTITGMSIKGDNKVCASFGIIVEGKVCFDTITGEKGELEGDNDFETRNTHFKDSSEVLVESRGLKLSTPASGSGKFGDRGVSDRDMVLVLGTSAKFITAKYVTFGVNPEGTLDSCSISIKDSTLWGDESESLLFFSRNIVESEFRKLLRSIKDFNAALDDAFGLSGEEIKVLEKNLNIAENSIKKWSALLTHWEEDRSQAKNHPLDLRDLAGGTGGLNEEVLNRIVLTGGEVTLSSSRRLSESSILDYQSTSSVSGFKEEDYYEWAIGGGGIVISPDNKKTTYETSTSKSRVERDDEETSNLMVVETLLAEDDGGDQICINVFQSPHSNTYVFEVCGGATSCPHIAGTDAREVFVLSVSKKPDGLLQEDAGFIELRIDTSEIQAGDSSILDLVLELDADTALSRVAIDIGSASANRRFEFSLGIGVSQAIPIDFRRLDPSVRSMQFGGHVRSACDPNLRQSFSFRVEWESNYPGVNWGKALVGPDMKFELSGDNPELELVAINPTDTAWRDVSLIDDVYVTLHGKLYDDVSADWFLIGSEHLRSRPGNDSPPGASFVEQEESDGSSTLWLSTGDDEQVFRSGERYILEIRAQYMKTLEDGLLRPVGEKRSGPRLGIVDFAGPSLISVDTPRSVKSSTKGFPAARFLFDEAIDCSPSLLRATISNSNTTIEGSVYCTSFSTQVNVVLELESENSVRTWSESSATVSLDGVRDIFGNQAQEAQPMLITFKMPALLPLDGATNEYQIPSIQELSNSTQRERDLLLPPSFIVPDSFASEEEAFTAVPTDTPTQSPTLNPTESTSTPTVVRGSLDIVGITMEDWYRHEDSITNAAQDSIANAAGVRSNQVTILKVEAESVPQRRRVLQEISVAVDYEVSQLPTLLRSFVDVSLTLPFSPKTNPPQRWPCEVKKPPPRR
jgi:hypothetical protein